MRKKKKSFVLVSLIALRSLVLMDHQRVSLLDVCYSLCLSYSWERDLDWHVESLQPLTSDNKQHITTTTKKLITTPSFYHSCHCSRFPEKISALSKHFHLIVRLKHLKLTSSSNKLSIDKDLQR